MHLFSSLTHRPLRFIPALCCLTLMACNQNKGPQAGPPPIPEVGVHIVAPREITLSTELSGRITPYQVAEVRPQITGIVQKRLFTEGMDVKAGMRLYQIDAALYQASYESARAQVSKAEANLNTLKLRATRYQELVKINAVSVQENDDAQAAMKQAAAEYEAAKAALSTARINLEYTSVKSPISGRIGKSEVTPGALVTANQPNALATVHQLDPIYVDVTQTANEWLRLKRDFESGRLQTAGENQALVEAILPDGTTYAEKGLLKFSSVTVDPGTGSFLVRAEFKNPKQELLPGMYVRARLIEGANANAILVPQRGITRNNQGQAIALVVAENGEVSRRIVKTTRTVGDQWLISEGLSAGEKVVIEGVQLIRFVPEEPPPVVKAVEKKLTPPGAQPPPAPQPDKKPAEKPAA